jgi:hypothetical protein
MFEILKNLFSALNMGGGVSDMASLAAESRGSGRGSKINVLNFKKSICCTQHIL